MIYNSLVKRHTTVPNMLVKNTKNKTNTFLDRKMAFQEILLFIDKNFEIIIITLRGNKIKSVIASHKTLIRSNKV